MLKMVGVVAEPGKKGLETLGLPPLNVRSTMSAFRSAVQYKVDIAVPNVAMVFVTRVLKDVLFIESPISRTDVRGCVF